MSNVSAKLPRQSPGAQLRAFRESAGLSLDDLADRIQRTGCDRPSIAKLSRIETGVQPVPLDIMDALVTVTRISAKILRPDLAKMFGAPPPRARRREGAAA